MDYKYCKLAARMRAFCDNGKQLYHLPTRLITRSHLKIGHGGSNDQGGSGEGNGNGGWGGSVGYAGDDYHHHG